MQTQYFNNQVFCKCKAMYTYCNVCGMNTYCPSCAKCQRCGKAGERSDNKNMPVRFDAKEAEGNPTTWYPRPVNPIAYQVSKTVEILGKRNTRRRKL